MTAFLVLVCGGLGAVARFAVGALVDQRLPPKYPFGTFVVNLSGSFLLGVFVGAGASHRVELIVGTTTLGSYTTFSTWMLESHRSAQDGAPGLAWRSVVISLTGGLTAIALGRALGRAL